MTQTNTPATKTKRRKVQKAADSGAHANTVTSNPLKLLVTVVNRSKTEFYADLIQSFDVNLQAVVLAEGTADANMMRYLGLTDTNKSVILSVVQQARLPDLKYMLDKKFSTVRDGKGIAFTIALSSVIGKLIFGFLSNNKSVIREDR